MRFLICVGLRLDLPNGTIRASLLRQCANNGADSQSRLLPPRWLLLNLATHGPQNQSAPPNQTPFYHQIVHSRVKKIYFICISKKMQKVIVFLPSDERYWSKKLRHFFGKSYLVDWYPREKGLMHRELLVEVTWYGEIKISNMTHFWRWRWHNFEKISGEAIAKTYIFSKVYHLFSQIWGPYLKL